MNNFLQKFRLPYREDGLFACLLLAVLVVPLSFTLAAYEKFEIVKITLLFLLVGSAGIIFFWRKLRGRQIQYAVNSKALWAALALGVWIIASSLKGTSLLNSFFGNYPRFTGSAVFYLLLLAFFILLVLSLNRGKLVVLLHVLMLDALVVSLVGIVQGFGIAYYTGLDYTGLQRPPSLLGNPDFSAMFLVILLPIGLYLLLSVEKLWQRVYYAVALGCMLFAVLVFSSRGAWLGAILALLVFAFCFLVYKAPKKYAITALVMLALGVLAFFVLSKQIKPSSLKKTFNLTEANVSSRIMVWDIAGQAMLERPVLGTAPGNFIYFFQSHRGRNLSDYSQKFDDPHNLFLQLGATLGIPFLLGFLVTLVLAVLSGAKRSWKTEDYLPLSLAVSLVAFCVVTSFSPVSSANLMLLPVLLAGLFLPYTVERLAGMFAYMGAFGAVFIATGVMFLTSELLFYHAYNSYLSGRYESCFKLCALAKKMNPTNQMFYAYYAASEAELKLPPVIVEQDIKKIINLYPHDSQSYTTAANIYYLLYENTHSLDWLQKSVDMMNQVVKLDPNNGFNYSYAALYYFGKGELNAAQDYASFGLTLQYNKDAPSWILLARIFQIKGNVKASRGALQHAYQLSPDNALLQALYSESQKISDKDFGRLAIPVFFNPLNVE